MYYNTRRSSFSCASLSVLLRRFGSDQHGNFLIIAGLAFPVMVAAVGVGVSYSSANASRTSLQSSLDAAVLAGTVALEDNSADAVSIAQAVFQNNLNNLASKSTTGIAATFTVSNSVFSGQATGSYQNPFGGIIGLPKTVSLKVTAAATPQTTPICVLGLDGLADGSFDINGGPTFNAACAVQANSTSTTGMTQEGIAPVGAKKFSVSGGHKTNNYSPPPVDGAASVADPYASLPFPAYTSCSNGGGKNDIKTDTTLSPGTYCGGLHIYATAHVTLLPGIYVMNGGPFWVDGSAVVTGDQVLIGFTGKGASLQIWGSSSVTLTSPTSGTYANMQFMQDDSSSDTHALWASIGGAAGNGNNDGTGSAKLSYDGVAYFPSQNFWMFGSATINANSPSMAIVADKVWVQGNATVNVTHNNPRNLSVTGPQLSSGAKLIQ